MIELILRNKKWDIMWFFLASSIIYNKKLTHTLNDYINQSKVCKCDSNNIMF